MRYRYSRSKNCFKFLLKIIDGLGYLVNKPEKLLYLDLKKYNSICFVQLGHIGDFILTLPTLYTLKLLSKEIKADIRLKVAILPENEIIAKKISFIDEIIVIHHKLMSRKDIHKKLRWISEFKKIHADLVFELRGDIRILPFLKMFARYKKLIGYREGGLGFLLDYYLDYPFNAHITQTYMKILNVAFKDITLKWNPEVIPYKEYKIPCEDYVCINIGVGAPAREWETIKFISLAEKIVIKLGKKIVFIGRTPKEKFLEFQEYYETLTEDIKKMIVNLINKTSILESIYIVKNSNLFVGLESGFTHISALLGIPTIAIYSDATDENVWKPINLYNNVYLIKKKVPCGNCGKLICSNNICMKLITVEEVVDKLMEVLER